MKRYKRMRALLPIMVLLLLLDITVTQGMLSNESTLNVMFGKGEQKVVSHYDTTDAAYYNSLYTSQKAAKTAATKVSKAISDEGIVLLKNDGLLPLSTEQALSPFGLAYFEPYYCGSGSSAIATGKDDVVSPHQGLGMVFSNLNNSLIDQQKQHLRSTSDAASNASITTLLPSDLSVAAQGTALYEFHDSIYDGLANLCQNTVGLVYIKRQMGENQDAYVSTYEDGTPHMLAITSAEQELIEFVTENCAGVVVILCSSSPMEIPSLQDNDEIDAIVWIGGAGSTGYASLADILVGHINPSGRLPATYPANFLKDPTYANHDDGSDRFVYSNATTTYITSTKVKENTPAAFHEYEEGIYLGYQYYETAFDTGALKDYYNRTDGVVYPFGYGLSYASFSQEISGYVFDPNQITLTIRVTNIGKQYLGKDVVQIYKAPPYTELDAEYGIEKSSAALLAFAKTRLLAPNESQEIKLTIPIEALASYCYTRQNPDGTKGCYMLEAGDYRLSLRSNSHDIISTLTYSVPQTIWYDNSNPRPSDQDVQTALDHDGGQNSAVTITDSFQAATNHFEQLNTYMTSDGASHAHMLSRSDWAATKPTAPTDKDRLASDDVLKAIAASDTTKITPDDDRETINAPISEANNGLILADLRGKAYDDPMWDALLDQLSYKDTEAIRQCLFEAGYKTGALKSIGKPKSVEHDGPQGLTLADVSGKNWLDDMCGYPAAPLMAATWNSELMYELGYMVGQEALIADINGWYAPGLNILRSPFCGRASEYYSEDAYLSGTLGSHVVSGAGDMGLYCAIKHFAIMETESHRSPHTATWMTEQALREVYLKPFEIVLKTARKTIQYTADNQTGSLETTVLRAGDFIMASDSAIGTRWTAANRELLTEVVRGEWGFQGAIISDMQMKANATLIDNLLHSGSDALMSDNGDASVNALDFISPIGQTRIRNAIKNICYAQVNSNLMQGIPPVSIVEYTLSPWMIWLIVINGIVALLLIVGVIICIQEIVENRRSSH